MKKYKILGLILVIGLLGSCSAEKGSTQETSSESKVEKSSISYTKSSQSSTSTSRSSTTHTTENPSSSSSTSINSEISSSSIDTGTLEANNNVSDASYDDATKTFTGPKSTIKIDDVIFDTLTRGTMAMPVMILRYTVTNTSDEIFNTATRGSLQYMSVSYESAEKKFQTISAFTLSKESDPYHEEYENRKKRLERGDSITIASSYTYPDDIKNLYVDFQGSDHELVKRLEIAVP